LELISHGNLEDDLLRMLASKLARIHNKSTEKQRSDFTELAHAEMQEISRNIFTALESGTLPLFISINLPNNERKGLVAPIVNNPKARQLLLEINAGFITTLMPGEDNLITKGFSIEEAKEVTSAFEAYCEENKDEIEALRIIWNNEGKPLTYEMLKDLENKLKNANKIFQPSRLWNSYSVVCPQSVKARTTKEEIEALTNIIQLVRFAFHQIERLESLYPTARQRFNLWYGQTQRNISETQIAVVRQVVDYIASNGSCTINDIAADDKTKAAQLIDAFGGRNKANEALESLSTFILYRRTA